MNKINTYTCHSYPMILQDLRLGEKVVVAYAHPIIIIIKLKPSNSSVFATYL